MWARMHELAARQMPAPTKILDLGCGPGEPACHFAARYAGVPTIASDLAPNMVALAERRVAAKGLANVECMVLDMEDLSPIADASVDLVIAQMAYMFVPDKPRALAEASCACSRRAGCSSPTCGSTSTSSRSPAA